MNLSYERACEIVEACVANGVFNILGDRGLPVPTLAGLSLSEMVEAQRVVREKEKAEEKPDGLPRTVHVVCDDRLVAALYVAAHYPGNDPSNVEPICVLPDGRAVVVVSADMLQSGEVDG